MENKQKALVFGATGLVGKQLVKQLADDVYYSSITVFNRRSQNYSSDKIIEIITDYGNLQLYKEMFKADVLFCCIGTTIKKAGSQEAFCKVDHDLPVKLSKLANPNIKNFIMISSLGASTDSSNFYLSTKGQTERDVSSTFCGKTYFVRPSLLMGDREEFRMGEKIGQLLMKAISPLLFGQFKKYKGIKDKNVAAAMIVIDKSNPQQQVFNSNELDDLAKEK